MFLEVFHDVRITFVISKFGEFSLLQIVDYLFAFNLVKSLVQVVTLDGKFAIEIWLHDGVNSVIVSLGVLLGRHIEKSIVYGELRLFLW